MHITGWIVATSTVVSAVATVAIAFNAKATLHSMRATEQERLDLYRAIVISNVLCSAIGHNVARMWGPAKEQFLKEYAGDTKILAN